MNEYIKKEDAENIMLGSCDESALWKLRYLPPADVVEVVRCKDCIHYDEHTRWQCDRFGQSVNIDDYCSYGERKEQERTIFLDESIDETAGYGEEQEN